MNTDSSKGQSLVLFALFLTVLLGGAAFVVDVGGAWSQGREQQKIADTAALAGATAETNGGTRAQIISAAVNSAVSNGVEASEVTVNIPPTSGAYAPGGSASGPLSANDCSTPAKYPCWVEVVVSRAHQNSLAAIPPFNQPTWQVTERGVAVGGLANAVTNGISPIMFSYASVQAVDRGTKKTYCMPQNVHCGPPTDWPWDDPEGNPQFAWTDFCVAHPGSCNVDTRHTIDLINGSGTQTEVYLGMYLGPNNAGGHDNVCRVLKEKYPDGADLPVAINDNNGRLVGFWIWHFVASESDCTGNPQISGWFVDDITATLPLTISANGDSTQFGQYIVRLVE